MLFIKPEEISAYIPAKWKNYAGFWPYMIPIFGYMYFRRIKSIIKKISQIKNFFFFSTILEVGGGFGLFGASFKMNFPEREVYLLDIYSNKIMNFVKNIMTNKFNINLKYNFECDIQCKPSYKSNSFDLIFALDVLEHLEYPNLSLDEILRILKKNGILFISVPTESKLINSIRYLYNKLKPVEINPHWNGTIKSEKDFFNLLKKKDIKIIWKQKYPYKFLPEYFAYDMFYIAQKDFK